ncbi:MAG: PadR family transcriptional regulator [bacterium]|nr:PadR family transcriptional regulator [bacterium]
MKELTRSEETVLLAIIRLKDNAYGVTIRDQIKEVTQREFVYGTLYSTLEQLVTKGYISKSSGDPTPERGGKRKIFFKMTKIGLSALQNNFAINKTVWQGITEETFDPGMIDDK